VIIINIWAKTRSKTIKGLSKTTYPPKEQETNANREKHIDVGDNIDSGENIDSDDDIDTKAQKL
jgi:hypothetical protein